VGNVPNVVFPCGALIDGAKGKLALYYGSADTVVSLAFGSIPEIVNFVKDNRVH
jgi:beta-1,4-mannooligosaccharide/beta-1,4-mannosyl-N-acetylglucosamine phosphorylase